MCERVNTTLSTPWEETSGQLQRVLDAHLPPVPDEEEVRPVEITALEAPGKRLAKVWRAGGRKRSYDKAAEFEVVQFTVQDFDDFVELLDMLERQPSACIIRGAPGRYFPGEGEGGEKVFRLLHAQEGYVDDRGRRVSTDEIERKGWRDRVGVDLYRVCWLPMFKEAGTAWVLLDFERIEFEPDWRDRLAETADWLKLRLPDAFADCSCRFQATGSAADPSKPDLGGSEVRMRLAFMLSRPLTGDQLKAWLGGIPGLDAATFEVVQPIYTSRPIFVGCQDPMPRRSGVLGACRTS